MRWGVYLFLPLFLLLFVLATILASKPNTKCVELLSVQETAEPIDLDVNHINDRSCTVCDGESEDRTLSLYKGSPLSTVLVHDIRSKNILSSPKNSFHPQNNVVMLAQADGTVACLDQQSGHRLWALQTGLPLFYSSSLIRPGLEGSIADDWIRNFNSSFQSTFTSPHSPHIVPSVDGSLYICYPSPELEVLTCFLPFLFVQKDEFFIDQFFFRFKKHILMSLNWFLLLLSQLVKLSSWGKRGFPLFDYFSL
jgi:hypothetical protein